MCMAGLANYFSNRRLRASKLHATAYDGPLSLLAAADVSGLPSEKYTVIVVNGEAAAPQVRCATFYPQL
jgi:hypothetical protein